MTNTAIISGRLVTDSNRDYTEVAAGGGLETGFAGIQVQLLRSDGVVLATTSTDASGRYTFANLPQGSYLIRVPTEISGQTIAPIDVGDPLLDSDANANGVTDLVTVSTGQQQLHVDVVYGNYNDGAVDGAASGEVMPVGYTDAQGDRITDGNDTIFANAGNDTIISGGGNDVVDAGSGADRVDAGTGNDTILGNAGDDFLRGNAGDDVISGDSGSLDSVPSVVTLTPVAGANRTVFVWDLSQVTVVNAPGNDNPFENSATGEDDVGGSTLRFVAGATPKTVGLNDNDSRFDDGDTSQVLASGTTLNGIFGAAGERLTPEYSYSLQSSSGDIINIYVVELDGNDVVGFVSDAPIDTSETYTFIARTDTTPEVNYSSLATSYTDGSVTTTVPTGGPGNDFIAGDAGDDTIFGDAGNDTIFGDSPVAASGALSGLDAVAINFSSVRAGSETAGPNAAVAGSSVIYDNVATLDDGTQVSARLVLVSKTSSHLQVDLAQDNGAEILLNGNNNNAMQGQSATFRFEFFNTVTGAPVVLQPGIVFGDLDSNGGAEIITISDPSLLDVGVAPNSSVAVSFNNGSMTASASGTQDVGNPDDPISQVATIFGPTSSVTFTMTARAFNSGLNFGTIDGANFTYVNGETTGDDFLSGGDGDDLILGNRGLDTLMGDAGNDTLLGGAGDDQLHGGAGNDSLVGGSEQLVDSPNLVTNGSFEAGIANGHFRYVSNGSLDGWLSNSGIIEVQANGVDGNTAADGTNWAEIDADSAVDNIYQDVTTPAGSTLTLSFEAQQRVAGGTDSVQVWFGGQLIDTITPATNSWQTYTYTVSGSGLDRLEFRELAAENSFAGPLLDNVSLTERFLASSDDTLSGGAGDDVLLGEGGDDVLDGGADDDTLLGGAGDDLITGGSGNDSLVGGSEQLTDGPNLVTNGSFEAGIADGNFTYLSNGSLDGWLSNSGIIEVQGNGLDGNTAADGTNWAEIDADSAVDNIYQDVTTTAGSTLTLSFEAQQRVDGGTDSVQVWFGGQLIDTITPATNSWQTYTYTVSGSGLDRLEFREIAGQSSAFGPLLDNVSLTEQFLASSDDTLSGGAGDDVLLGEGGDDVLSGDAGNDTIDGGDGDDVITGGSGDRITGGAGADSIVIDADALDALGGTGTGIVVDGGSTGLDNDTLDLRDYAAYRNLVTTNDPDGNSVSGSVEVIDDTGAVRLVTFTEIESLLLPPPEVVPDGVVDGLEAGEVMGPGYADAEGDTIDGPDGLNDVIEGNGGDDTIDAGAGDDTVDGGTGDDVIAGGAGDDVLAGGLGDDEIAGGAGADDILGGAGSDTLAGGAGDDTLDGGDGDDDIAVGGGDVAAGGDGDDVFTLDPTDPATDVDVTLDGGRDGTDGFPAGPENGDAGDVLDLSDEAGDLSVILGTDPESGTVDGLDADGTPDITFDEIEKVLTGSGDDVIDGGASTGPIDVDAGAGDDDVTGGSGDDAIAAGPGNDTVDAGAGDDTVAGGAGD
ncbi:SdrD B-like domain-containing protein, partial [Roseicyclus marinus]|uniref:beta strand repeat-containing protein n=3 Tax=Roseicyclus marinus TaxID=2161673 RepID=UPI00240EE37C